VSMIEAADLDEAVKLVRNNPFLTAVDLFK
jgi:hypothetical protein